MSQCEVVFFFFLYFGRANIVSGKQLNCFLIPCLMCFQNEYSKKKKIGTYFKKSSEMKMCNWIYIYCCVGSMESESWNWKLKLQML